jgi:hypothetical protein
VTRATAVIKSRMRVLAGLAGLLLVSALAVTDQTPARAQADPFVLIWSGDVSPPTNESRGDDYGTAEVILAQQPDLVCLAGDDQYETGSGAMFNSPVGFQGSWGRFKALIKCPARGNHDVADPGPGAPGWWGYFGDQLRNLPCTNAPTPCRPEEGYFVLDLDVNNDGRLDWFIIALDSNCGRVSGATGDSATPSCANDSPQINWLRSVFAARHGGANSGRKCSAMIWHHERWGTGFFNDDPAMTYAVQVGNHFHNDLLLAGHTHSMARTGPMTWDGRLSTSGQRQITAGAGGRSLTANRVDPPREGTRWRQNTRYGVNKLTLTTSTSTAGWTGGTWKSEMLLVGQGPPSPTVADPAQAGCWP